MLPDGIFVSASERLEGCGRPSSVARCPEADHTHLGDAGRTQPSSRGIGIGGHPTLDVCGAHRVVSDMFMKIHEH